LHILFVMQIIFLHLSFTYAKITIARIINSADIEKWADPTFLLVYKEDHGAR